MNILCLSNCIKLTDEKYDFRKVKIDSIKFPEGEEKYLFGNNINKIAFTKRGIGLCLDRLENTIGLCVIPKNVEKLNIEELKSLAKGQSFDIIDLNKLTKKELTDIISEKIIKQ